MTGIKRNALTLQDKIDILKVFDERSPNQKQKQIAVELNLPPTTLRSILKNREEIEEIYKFQGGERKRQKVGKFDILENVLVEWLHQVEVLQLPITGTIICEKALKIAASLQITDFNASNGWIDRFKHRHGVKYRRRCGNLETEEDVDTWMAALPALLQNYEHRDIFNADEFGLFYKLMPDNTDAFKGETCHDGIASKERLTVLACTNSDGSEKLGLLVIGNTENPRCLKNIKSLPVTYDAQLQAWMTGRRFGEWLKALDSHFQAQSRNVILFIDTCPAHPKNVALKNIKLVFLPRNMSSELQPMNQGIIKVLKQGYRTRLIYRHIQEMEETDSKRPFDVHDAILNLAAAWDAIKPETIRDCFLKAGFRNDEGVIVEEGEPTILESFPGYSSIDDNVACYEIRSIEDLILHANNFKQEAVSDDDAEGDKKDSTPILSNAQALLAVNDLKRYVSSLDESKDALQKLNYIENLIINKAPKSDCLTKVLMST